MKKTFFAMVLLAVSLPAIAWCQDDSTIIRTAVSKLKTLLTDHIIEKAYLHLDHPYPYYVAGDNVYFKAYVTMGELHQPSTISGMLHVDLIDKKDSLMKSITLQIADGVGWGDFALPGNLRKGVYCIRAYTEWMRNEKLPNYFERSISVSSAVGVDGVAATGKQMTKPAIQFFPEGGNLITDVYSKVAFKAVGPDGFGINVNGVVVDNSNTEIARIVSTHLGMGVFDFTPQLGRTYKAKLTFADGSKSSADLPLAEEKGITLSVNSSDPEKVAIEIRANRNYYTENLNKELNLLIYSQGAIRRLKTKLDNNVLYLDLPANTFHTGILQVTLLSQTGEPLAERLSFIQNNDLLNLGITSNKTVFSKRENVQLALNVKNKEGNPVNGSFSVSVVDESKILVDENAENSILSYLLLTSDLKGYIEKPNYYFAHVTDVTRKDLDILMLTQGYRRFVWKQLLNDNTVAGIAHKPEKDGIDITGHLKSKEGKPIVGCVITLIPASGGGQVSTAETDTRGKFRFANMVFTTGTRFILKIKSSQSKNAVLTFDDLAPEPIVGDGESFDKRYDANADLLASLQNTQKPAFIQADSASTGLKVKEDNAKAFKRMDNYRSSNIVGPGHADQVIMGDEFKNYPSLSLALSSLGHGVVVYGGVASLRSSLTISGMSQHFSPMLVIVDGANMGAGYPIESYNPGSVETIEILKGANASIYGVQGGGGVLVITTRTGAGREEMISKEMSPGIFSIEPKGFYKAREFYSPSYDAVQPANNVPDWRTTIFWKPDINTDADGNASLNFFNADGAGTYRVVIEGIDAKGDLGRQVYRYKVQ